MNNKLIVYLERLKTRQEVGSLEFDQETEEFIFHYEKAYLNARSSIPLGPGLSLVKSTYRSKRLFPDFVDRIPSRKNPAYSDYCQATGISEDEDDPIILLGSIGRKGPSSFVFECIQEESFGPNELKQFRRDLGMTTREFAACFEISQSTLTRVENEIESGREVLKRLEIYVRFPAVALDQIANHGGLLIDEKRKVANRKLEKYCSEGVKEKSEFDCHDNES